MILRDFTIWRPYDSLIEDSYVIFEKNVRKRHGSGSYEKVGKGIGKRINQESVIEIKTSTEEILLYKPV